MQRIVRHGVFWCLLVLMLSGTVWAPAGAAAMDKVYAAESEKNPFFAKVLNSQRAFAKRAVPHAQRIQPPLELLSQHYWK